MNSVTGFYAGAKRYIIEGRPVRDGEFYITSNRNITSWHETAENAGAFQYVIVESRGIPDAVRSNINKETEQ